MHAPSSGNSIRSPDWRRPSAILAAVKTDQLTAKGVVLACVLAVLVVFALEGIPHRHASASADRSCPACQAARQHVGDAPQSDGTLLASPTFRPSQPAEPAIERLAGAPAVSSASPRAPPSAA